MTAPEFPDSDDPESSFFPVSSRRNCLISRQAAGRTEESPLARKSREPRGTETFNAETPLRAVKGSAFVFSHDRLISPFSSSSFVSLQLPRAIRDPLISRDFRSRDIHADINACAFVAAFQQCPLPSIRDRHTATHSFEFPFSEFASINGPASYWRNDRGRSSSGVPGESPESVPDR